MDVINEIATPRELLNYMSNNINYGYLGKDNKVHLWSDPDFNDVWHNEYVLENYDDVLRTKVGNCWDQVEFERTWFLSRGYKIMTFYEQVILDYDNPYPTHSFLTFNENDKWYWFENSDGSNRGIHEFNSLNELLDYQLARYRLFLKNNFNIKEEEINKIKLFVYYEPKYHSTADEYIDNIINGINIMDIREYIFQDENNPKYLFHGSPKKIDVLEKRQSHDSDNNPNNIDNAVFLTSSFITATAYAFKDSIKEASKDLSYDFNINNYGEIPIMVMENVIIPENLEGYIYVFEKDDSFENVPIGSFQYKSHSNLKPNKVLKVNYKDYKNNYKIKQED